MNTPTATLYLRTDGSLMLAKGDVAIELQLTPAQLLQIGMDCLQVAVAHVPQLLPIVASAIASTDVPAHLVDDTSQALESSNVVEATPCRLN